MDAWLGPSGADAALVECPPATAVQTALSCLQPITAIEAVEPPAFAPLLSRSMAALLASASDRPLLLQVALTRTALDRVIANKPLFFACPPTLAAAVAAPECGGLGQAALRGTVGMVTGEDSHMRCSELLLKALQGNARGITSLVSPLCMLLACNACCCACSACCCTCCACCLHCLLVGMAALRCPRCASCVAAALSGHCSRMPAAPRVRCAGSAQCSSPPPALVPTQLHS